MSDSDCQSQQAALHPKHSYINSETFTRSSRQKPCVACAQDTAAAMNVIQLSAANKATVAAATEMGSAVRTAALASFGSSLPTSLSTAASHLDFASLVQDPTVQSAAVPVLQAAAAAAGNSWNADALVRAHATFLKHQGCRTAGVMCVQ